jgi:hypothetical protein
MDRLIIPPGDSNALADAIARLAADRKLLRELSANALRTVQKYKMPVTVWRSRTRWPDSEAVKRVALAQQVL